MSGSGNEGSSGNRSEISLITPARAILTWWFGGVAHRGQLQRLGKELKRRSDLGGSPRRSTVVSYFHYNVSLSWSWPTHSWVQAAMLAVISDFIS
jgi:hypothetical protein